MRSRGARTQRRTQLQAGARFHLTTGRGTLGFYRAPHGTQAGAKSSALGTREPAWEPATLRICSVGSEGRARRNRRR